jgi:beta-glucosidase
MGLFEQPYVDELSEAERYLLPEYLEVAEQQAAESMVLLKNENNTLPIQSTFKNIALIGPMVKNQRELMGSWEGMGLSENVVSIFEGMTKEFDGKATLHYALGCEFEGDNMAGFDEAVAAAQKSDVVLVFLGEKTRWSGENASRSTIALPAIQEQLVETLKKTGKPIVLVLSSGRPLELVRLEKMADAMLHIWQPGTVGGPAVASILSGRANPSGRLAITFPLTTGQIPMYYNMRQSSRPNIGQYQDISKEPMYWFGHGLSYTTYNYGTVKLSAEKITKSEKLIAEVEVKNDGNMDGKETVFWFIADPVCSVSRPMKELKFFEKKELKSGESTVYRFEIDPIRDLSYVNSNGDKLLESGEFFLMVKDQKVKFELID